MKIMYLAGERRHKNYVDRGMLPLSLNPKMGDKISTKLHDVIDMQPYLF